MYVLSIFLINWRISECQSSQSNLEKQVKELSVRIVDQETKSYAKAAPSSRRRDSRIEELTNQLHQTNKDKGDSSKSTSLQRSPGKSQHPDTDRQKTKSEAQNTRKNMDAMVCY